MNSFDTIFRVVTEPALWVIRLPPSPLPPPYRHPCPPLNGSITKKQREILYDWGTNTFKTTIPNHVCEIGLRLIYLKITNLFLLLSWLLVSEVNQHQERSTRYSSSASTDVMQQNSKLMNLFSTCSCIFSTSNLHLDLPEHLTNCFW